METKEIKRRKRTYKASNPTKVIKDGWCHQCKMKQPEVIACANFWKSKKDNKCGGKYCSKCIEKHYQQNFNQLIEIERWICFSCDHKCTCAVCKRKRGSYSMKKRQYTHKKNRLNKEKEDGLEMHQYHSIPIRYDINPSFNSYQAYHTSSYSSYNPSYNPTYDSSSSQSYKQQAIYMQQKNLEMNNESPNNFYVYPGIVQSIPIQSHFDQYAYSGQHQLSYHTNELNDTYINNIQHPRNKIYIYQDTFQTHPNGGSPPKSDLSYICNPEQGNETYASMENDNHLEYNSFYQINPLSSDQNKL